MLTQVMTAGIEGALNQYLKLDDMSFNALASFSGKVIALDLKGTGLVFYLFPDEQGIQVMQHYDGLVDTTISGSPFALLRMKIDERGRDTLFEGDVVVSGDMRTGQAFNRLLESIHVDWEEHFSHLVGDSLAHGVGNKVRDFLSWGISSGKSVRDDVAEYLHEESRDLPVRDEVEYFMERVDEVRSDVERFELRLLRLKKQLSDLR